MKICKATFCLSALGCFCVSCTNTYQSNSAAVDEKVDDAKYEEDPMLDSESITGDNGHTSDELDGASATDEKNSADETDSGFVDLEPCTSDILVREKWVFHPLDLTYWDDSTADEALLTTEDTIYVAFPSLELHALDSDDGSIKWTSSAFATYQGGMSLGPGGEIFLYNGFQIEQREIYRIDPENGDILWKFSDEPAFAPVAGKNGMIYVRTGAPELVALNAQSGEEVWRVESDSGFDEPVVALDGKIYVSKFMENTLFALDPSDGSVMREWKFDAHPYPLVIGLNGILFVPAGGLHAVDPDAGNILWSVERESQPRTLAVGPDGTIYFASSNPDVPSIFKLSALQSATGQVLWYREMDGSPRFTTDSLSPDGSSLTLGLRKEILAIDTRQWKVLLRSGDRTV